MATTSTGINEYNMDGCEYFINVEQISPTPDKIKAYIPKYMPQVVKGKWKTPVPVAINLANAPDCSVPIPRIITEQGYYTIGHYPNEQPNFVSKAVTVLGKLVVQPGNTFMAEVLYNDPTDIKFIGKV